MYLSPPVVRRVILLLGPTQVGKSSVANFLINSIVNDGRNKLAVGDGTESCTQQPQCESFTYTYQVNMEEKVTSLIYSTPPSLTVHLQYAEFSVIDTAGAGDSEEKDPENMVELYKYLLEENIEISCVVLVVRYPTLADRQYKSIINLYKKMLSTVLPSLHLLLPCFLSSFFFYYLILASSYYFTGPQQEGDCCPYSCRGEECEVGRKTEAKWQAPRASH